jgi:hypothetical protein
MHQIINGHRHGGLPLSLVLFVFMATSLSTLEAEKTANRLGYHVFFVRMNVVGRNPARRRGNHASGAAVPE